MIKILLVDDQKLIRQGIIGLLNLQEKFDVIAQAADGVEALAILQHLNHDVLLLDIRMPKLNGIEVLKTLKEKNRQIPTLLLTTFDDDQALFKGVEYGAKGFLLKDVSIDYLSQAIETIANGKTFFSPVIKHYAIEQLQHNNESEPHHSTQLTPREHEVLRLIAGGYNNKEIARILGNTEGTIKNQVASIFNKLQVNDRIRAVLKGIDNGYIQS